MPLSLKPCPLLLALSWSCLFFVLSKLSDYNSDYKHPDTHFGIARTYLESTTYKMTCFVILAVPPPNSCACQSAETESTVWQM